MKNARRTNVVDFPADQYFVSEVICVKCGKRWVAMRPDETLLKDLECPECHLQGFVIETGQFIEECKED